MGTEAKPPCQYGAKCYRKNPLHLENYSHPSKTREPAGAEENTVEADVKSKAGSHKTKMKQATLNFIQSSEFSSAPKTKTSNRDEKNVNLQNQKEPRLTKNKDVNKGKKVSESVQVKRKREILDSENKKAKVKKLGLKTKAISCFQGNNSSVEVVESNDGYSSDGGTVQSTSWTFLKNTSADEDPVSREDFKGKTTEEIIKIFYLVDMPPDFYSFYEFCKSLNENEPVKALETCDLNLVGAFDILAGKMNYSVNREQFLCHWRYYYDPPEFQTVLAAKSGYHIGYWRDVPKENPVFLASNNSETGCTFKIEAENIFGTLFNYMNELTKRSDPFKKVNIAKLQNALSEWAQKNNFSLESKTKKMSERQKKVVSKTFHSAGIVVPVQPKSKVGYRPLIETDAKLKKICKLITDASDEEEKNSLWDNLQPLITAANIANDECDFGNSLELGIDLFCTGSSVFHETVDHLLSTAYTLLDRTEFEKIIKAHLKFRRRGNNLSVLNDI